jgi:hypothetical protein
MLLCGHVGLGQHGTTAAKPMSEVVSLWSGRRIADMVLTIQTSSHAAKMIRRR